jgi:DNA-directed RNA polymerase specialized sigma24 family protein
VRGLDEAPRDAFILGELRGLTSREAADVLSVSRTTANSRRAAATAEIRKELMQQ